MADLQRNGVVERDINQIITTLKKRTYLLKYGRRGKPKFCPFKLSNDESKLIWYSRKEKHLKLGQVYRIIPGQRTAVFQRYPQPEKEYQSFSLICHDRTLDLICKDKEEAEVWFFGLKALISNGIHRKWRVEAGSDIVSVVSTKSHNKTSSPNSHFDQGDAQGIQSPIQPHNRLGKAFADIATHPASIKVANKSDLVEFSFLAVSCVENTNNQSSVADATRVGLSSPISSSSHGSCKEDIDALVDIFIWGQGVGDGILGGGKDRVESLFNTKIDALLPKALESTMALDVHNIACGSSHAVIVTKQGAIFSWGEESGGRLGHGVDVDVPQPKLVDSLSGMNFESIACGEYHTCAVTASGDLYTWGDGAHNSGLLGHGSDVSHWIPRRVSNMDGIHVSYVSCGPWHTALLTSEGQLFTFGDGSFGALGHGDRCSTTIPREVESLSGLRTIRVACGAWHTAAVVEVVNQSSDDGCPDSSSTKLFTWGAGDKGELGHGDREPRLLPQIVATIFDYDISQVACGQNLTVALTTSGQVYTMGSSAYGQLGSPTADGKVPTRVKGKLVDSSVEEIACGSHHVAIVTSKKEVYTWGKGTNGQLGHGDTDDRDTPTLVDFLKDKKIKSVVCGSNFTVVISLHKWVSSIDQSMCSGCRNPFGFIRKRHNCYNCGLIFCNTCTMKKSLKASLAPTMNKPYRVCDDCFAKLKKCEESVSSLWPPKDRNRNFSRKSIENIDKVLPPRSPIQHSRMPTFCLSNQAESRSCKSELKLDIQNRSIFSPYNGNFHLGGCNTSRPSISPVRDSKKNLPTPVSRRTSRASSPASGKSSNRSSTVTIDDSKQIDDSINREIIYLRAKVDDLTCKSRHLEAKLEKTSRQLKEVTAIAENEGEKYKSAGEVIKSLTAKLEQVTNMLPSGQNGFYNVGSIAKHTSNIEHVFPNNINATSMMCTPSEVSCNANNLPTSNGTKGQTKTIIQDEPGVYVTLLPLPNGSNVLQRVRFSRKHFTEENAEKWWAANGAKLYERHNIIRPR
ncbi:hypothetical protein like AT1G69710 [Hibiscus trionum]|uniref:Uncharacterized protein n=1 Tax=Hibiscus trionum TaxID=183268 RepID=A0A9W7IZ84_HIBTR|nr:hypothetical protein like AT1G69710 [Hibiscus trionum]